MDTVTNEITTRELRSQLSDVLGRAMYAEDGARTTIGELRADLVS
jgi:hypothetical protein